MVTPLGLDCASTWKALISGIGAGEILKGSEWDRFNNPVACRILDFKPFGGLEKRDRSLQLAVASAREAWNQAGLKQVSPERIGTTFSSSKGGILSLLAATSYTERTDFLSDFFPHAGGRIFQKLLGFTGPCLSVSSACSTGLGSLVAGATLLADGGCDAVIAGSTESSIHPLIYAAFQNMRLLSRREMGPSPFGVGRDGFLMGEGSAVLVLERERPDSTRMIKTLASLSGWALGGDGYDWVELNPKGNAIIRIIWKALEEAGLKPQDIGYINAHGTGTRQNDLIEANAIREVFGSPGPWVSSTKSSTGHLLGAAGSVEAVLSILAIIQGELPETRNLITPDPECRIRHVERGGMRQRVEHVLSLSYGFGGQLGAVIFSRI